MAINECTCSICMPGRLTQPQVTARASSAYAGGAPAWLPPQHMLLGKTSAGLGGAGDSEC